MNTMLMEMVDELLDSEGDIIIAGVTFSRSAILKEMDPTAYREIMLDMADSHITDLEEELELLIDSDKDGENLDEIEDLKCTIRNLYNV